jgi:thymidylate synthase
MCSSPIARAAVYDPDVGSGGFIWTGGDCHIYSNACQISFLTT